MEKLDFDAEKVGLNRSDYIRKRVLGHRIHLKPGFFDEEVIRQLKRIGNNLNQSVKLYHEQKKEPIELKQTAIKIDQMLEVMMETILSKVD